MLLHGPGRNPSPGDNGAIEGHGLVDAPPLPADEEGPRRGGVTGVVKLLIPLAEWPP